MGLAGDRCRLFATACALSLLLPSSVPAEGDPSRDPSARKETAQWLRPVRPGAVLRVVNRYGNVYARFGGYESEVEVLATTQRLEPDLPTLEVGFAEVADGLRVEVGPPEAGADLDTRDRVDVVVFVPLPVAFLDVQTRDGLIEIKGLRSDVTASAVKGDITIRSVDGRVGAKTARGRIDAALETGATAEPQALATETGDVEVWLWEDADMTVSLRTSGEISTDFSLEIEHRRFEEPSKHATAVVGRGGPELTLSSKQGRLRLLRLQRQFKPSE